MNTYFTNTPKRFDFLISIFVALSVFSSDMYLSAMPQIIQEFETTLGKAQFTLTGYFLGFSISILICGPLIDRFGRRLVMLIGLGLFILSSVLCLFATSISVFILARVLQAFGGCCTSMICRIMGKDLCTSAHEPIRLVHLFSLMFTVMASSLIIAPLLGSQILDFVGWRGNFIFLLGLSCFLFFVTMLFLPETLPDSERQKICLSSVFNHYVTVVRNKQFLFYTTIISLVWIGFFAFLSCAPILFMDYFGTTPSGYAVNYSLAVSGFVFGSLAAKNYFLTSQISPLQFIYYGLILIFSSGVLMFGLCLETPSTILYLVILMFFYLFGTGFILSHCQMLAIAPFKSEVSYALPLIYFFKMTSGALVGWWVSQEIAKHPHALSAVVSTVSIVTLMLFLLGNWHRFYKPFLVR